MPIQNKFLKFILIGAFFATVGEFLFTILIENKPGTYLFTLFFYPAFLTFIYFSSKILDVVFRKRVVADIAYYLIYGFIGLMIEWFVAGNTPWGNPNANQIGMFSFWVAVSFMPRIFVKERNDLTKLKRWVLVFFISYSFISIITGLLLPDSFRLFWLVWLVVIGYTFMNIFYIWYFIISLKAVHEHISPILS